MGCAIVETNEKIWLADRAEHRWLHTVGVLYQIARTATMISPGAADSVAELDPNCPHVKLVERGDMGSHFAFDSDGSERDSRRMPRSLRRSEF